ncbi:LapA family protein [Paenibacillus daejeonensis]|uniref:LapA family protein n=1 Tax=Paenibacillus daejeonensis TaxID=135193 RepID=UPI00037C3E7F|nr:lipopolysaccharide assembly protein LapA domain-containing protein [Paenibacillus daejeonensis]
MSNQSSMKVQWLIISALVFAVITAIFAVINVDSVQVNFLFTTVETPLILVILISTLLGGLMVFLFSFVRQVQMQRRVKQLEKQLAEAERVQTSPIIDEPVGGFTTDFPKTDVHEPADETTLPGEEPRTGLNGSTPDRDR